jgi:hypothetical protein
MKLPFARVGEQLTRQVGGQLGTLDDLAQVLLGSVAGG